MAQMINLYMKLKTIFCSFSFSNHNFKNIKFYKSCSPYGSTNSKFQIPTPEFLRQNNNLVFMIWKWWINEVNHIINTMRACVKMGAVGSWYPYDFGTVLLDFEVPNISYGFKFLTQALYFYGNIFSKVKIFYEILLTPCIVNQNVYFWSNFANFIGKFSNWW